MWKPWYIMNKVQRNSIYGGWLMTFIVRFTSFFVIAGGCVRERERVCVCVCVCVLIFQVCSVIKQSGSCSSTAVTHYGWFYAFLCLRDTNSPPPSFCYCTHPSNNARPSTTEGTAEYRQIRILTSTVQINSFYFRVLFSQCIYKQSQCKVSINRCTVCPRLLESLSLSFSCEIPVSSTAAALCVCRGDLHLLYWQQFWEVIGKVCVCVWNADVPDTFSSRDMWFDSDRWFGSGSNKWIHLR